MNCTDFLKQLTDYFDGRVEPSLMREVQVHLAECHRTARWCWTPRGRPSPSIASTRSTSFRRSSSTGCTTPSWRSAGSG